QRTTGRAGFSASRALICPRRPRQNAPARPGRNAGRVSWARALGADTLRPQGATGGLALKQTQFSITTAAATDVGRRRAGNEDSYSLWTAEGNAAAHAADHLVVVCDGMGGSNAGEVASRMAADTVVREVAAAAPDDPATA